MQGIKNNQKAIFDLQNNKSIYLKDFKNYTIKLQNKYINLNRLKDVKAYCKKYDLKYYIDNNTNKRKNIKKYTYILYQFNKSKNDFNYITESDNIKDFEKITKREASNLYKNIYKSIEKIKEYNNKYLIIKECI